MKKRPTDVHSEQSEAAGAVDRVAARGRAQLAEQAAGVPAARGLGDPERGRGLLERHAALEVDEELLLARRQRRPRVDRPGVAARGRPRRRARWRRAPRSSRRRAARSPPRRPSAARRLAAESLAGASTTAATSPAARSAPAIAWAGCPSKRRSSTSTDTPELAWATAVASVRGVPTTRPPARSASRATPCAATSSSTQTSTVGRRATHEPDSRISRLSNGAARETAVDPPVRGAVRVQERGRDDAAHAAVVVAQRDGAAGAEAQREHQAVGRLRPGGLAPEVAARPGRSARRGEDLRRRHQRQRRPGGEDAAARVRDDREVVVARRGHGHAVDRQVAAEVASGLRERARRRAALRSGEDLAVDGARRSGERTRARRPGQRRPLGMWGLASARRCGRLTRTRGTRGGWHVG